MKARSNISVGRVVRAREAMAFGAFADGKGEVSSAHRGNQIIVLAASSSKALENTA